MIEKLHLPFPLLSDPDRAKAIIPYGLADERDPRNLARPAVVIVGPDRMEHFRATSRDFADRLSEDALVEALRRLGLPPSTQRVPSLGRSVPGPGAMPFEHLYPYFRGARFAVVAMSRRHAETREDAEAYIAEMDRYMENVKRLFQEKKAAGNAD